MNRHAPLFRVAFLSLLLAISLPLLVFVAAQVRQRQLKSKANPRWARFSAVNGSRVAETPSTDRDVAATTPTESPPENSHRLPVRIASRSNGMTGSATGNAQSGPPLSATPPLSVELPVPSIPRNPPIYLSIPNQLSSRQTAEVPSAPPARNALVPVPNDDPFYGAAESQPAAPKISAKPKIEFRAVDETPSNDAASRRIEEQLAGLHRRLDQLAQAQTDKQVSDLERALAMLKKAEDSRLAQLNLPEQLPPPAPPVQSESRRPMPVAAEASSPGSSGGNVGGREPTIKIVQGEPGDADERFSIQVQDANLTEVLEMLGQLAGVNILASRDVQGRVSLNLQDVNVDKALDAILRSQGYVHEREGDFIYVKSAAEATAMKQANRKLITKIYQLHYINASEIQKLITPILTPEIGRHAITSPAQSGIAPTSTDAGGDGLSQRDTLLVQDFPEVIAEVDKILIELDVPPLQVMIEAKILSVALSDTMAFGVNFALLNGAKGFPATGSMVPPAGESLSSSAGLKYGFIQGDTHAFIKSLEAIADTSLVAAPQLRVLNKQKAELIIGQRLGYKTLAFNGTQTIENVQFMDTGTKLVFRPFISPDGLVRLEVHPERSRAKINEKTGLPNAETTEVTTNVMVRDGTTVVLGGLISEECREAIDRVPVLGSIPWVGGAFRNKSEQVSRNEMIVLITPRIVTEPEAMLEGEKLQFETESRAAHFRDSLSPHNRTSLTRAHYERACACFEQGNLLKAKQQIDAALLQNKGDLECQKLKLKIDQALRDQQGHAWKWPGGRAVRR
ncbi:MAG: type and secretion system protein [Schlesneria sp.]|nr:type and secretion system protein [Schlesneria sp.]